MFTQDVTILDFIIRLISGLPIIIIMILFLIREIIIKPIKFLINKVTQKEN